jgi:drug/metabolite transporter (DMT)-like permease
MSLLLLVIAWIATAVTMVSTKLIVQMGLGSHSVPFVMLCTVAAAITAGLFYAFQRSKIEKKDVVVGLVMGVSGAIAVTMLVQALRHIPGMIVFPVRSSGSIALTATASCVFMHERLSPRQWLGVALAVVAVYLLV